MKELFEGVGDGTTRNTRAGVCKVMSPFCYAAEFHFMNKGRKVELYTPAQVKYAYMNWRTITQNKDGNEKVVSFVDKWMCDPDMKTYAGVDMNPKNKIDPPDTVYDESKTEPVLMP